MTNNTGGPAFPSGVVRKTRQRPNDPGSDFIISDTVEAKNSGLSLRDYFAAHFVSKIYEVIDSGGFVEAAKLAYQMADAMLKEREK